MYDELLYMEALYSLLVTIPEHFIIDQSRSGVAGIRPAGWISWCNIEGAGFGIRPTTATPDSRIDAIVWVKRGGESDGTGPEPFCQLSGSLIPSPAYGLWFQDYFNTLVTHANPPFM